MNLTEEIQNYRDKLNEAEIIDFSTRKPVDDKPKIGKVTHLWMGRNEPDRGDYGGSADFLKAEGFDFYRGGPPSVDQTWTSPSNPKIKIYLRDTAGFRGLKPQWEIRYDHKIVASGFHEDYLRFQKTIIDIINGRMPKTISTLHVKSNRICPGCGELPCICAELERNFDNDEEADLKECLASEFCPQCHKDERRCHCPNKKELLDGMTREDHLKMGEKDLEEGNLLHFPVRTKDERAASISKNGILQEFMGEYHEDPDPEDQQIESDSFDEVVTAALGAGWKRDRNIEKHLENGSRVFLSPDQSLYLMVYNMGRWEIQNGTGDLVGEGDNVALLKRFFRVHNMSSESSDEKEYGEYYDKAFRWANRIAELRERIASLKTQLNEAQQNKSKNKATTSKN